MYKFSENLKKVYSMFGIDLTDSELHQISIDAQKNNVTPLGDSPTMAVSPKMAIALINIARTRKNNLLNERQLKKISEEIMPAVHFALFLKKIGRGEHFLLPREAPDIAFIRKPPLKKSLRIFAIPLEITFVKINVIGNANDTSEEFVNIIVRNKFNKRYFPQTILLVVVDAITIVTPSTVCRLIKNYQHTFHDIFIHGYTIENKIIFTKVYPELQDFDPIDIQKDFQSIMY